MSYDILKLQNKSKKYPQFILSLNVKYSKKYSKSINLIAIYRKFKIKDLIY